MFTDHHVHLLPDMDDGPSSCADSLALLCALEEKLSVSRFCATSHYRPHRETVSEYLSRRQSSYDKLCEFTGGRFDIVLGAEVYLERGISQMENIELLTYADTQYMLLELPDCEFEPWISEEIYNLSVGKKIIPVFAHIERYFKVYPQSAREQILSTRNAVFQFTVCDLARSAERKIFKSLVKDGLPVILGSDGHGVHMRVQDAPLGLAKIKKYFSKEEYDLLLKGHII